MKIAMIGHKQYNTRSGGIEVMMTNLTNALAAKGHTILVYDRHVSGTEKSKPSNNPNIIVKNIWTIKGKASAMVYSVFATCKAIKDKPDVIHFHAIGPAAMCPLAKLFGYKVVCTVHGLDWNRAKWGKFASWYLKFGEKMAVKHADELVVLSQSMADYYKKEYDRDTVFVRNGIDYQKLVEDREIQDKTAEYMRLNEVDSFTERTPLDLKKPFILYIGRIVPEKRLDLLLAAYDYLCHLNYPMPDLVIAGEISKNELHKEFMQRSSGNAKIHYLGYVEGDDVNYLYQQMKEFVLPSDIEGMSIALLEGLQTGKPCIISDIPDNENIADQYVYKFKKGDCTSLVNLLSQDLKGSEEQAEYIKREYGTDHMANAYLNLYEKYC